jgi:hypothetical protein
MRGQTLQEIGQHHKLAIVTGIALKVVRRLFAFVTARTTWLHRILCVPVRGALLAHRRITIAQVVLLGEGGVLVDFLVFEILRKIQNVTGFECESEREREREKERKKEREKERSSSE